MTESYVQLPPNSSGKTIRLLELSEPQVADDGTVTYTVVGQEVATLADDDGNLLLRGGLGGKTLDIGQQAIVDRLDEMLKGMALLISLTMAVGRPKGPLYVADKWIDEYVSTDRS